MRAAIRGVLLCGGASTRFGADKLLAAMGDGRALVAHSAQALMAGAGSVLAVVPAGRRDLRAVLEPLGCEVLESDRTSRGIGASLAAAVVNSRPSLGWIVALGDMPFIHPQTIAAVRTSIQSGALIAAPRLPSGERGHPVGFAAALRQELEALDGDEGARSVLERHRAALALVAVDDAGILRDVDTRAELDSALRAQLP